MGAKAILMMWKSESFTELSLSVPLKLSLSLLLRRNIAELADGALQSRVDRVDSLVSCTFSTHFHSLSRHSAYLLW